ncbi:tetratricopeptide repeat protein [Myxococcota bacterium]|nr:tetratricopeptide repeat protein [Myxococcota bacterium]
MRGWWIIAGVAGWLMACGGAQVRPEPAVGIAPAKEAPQVAPEPAQGGEAPEDDPARVQAAEQAARDLVAGIRRSGMDPAEARNRLLALVQEGQESPLAWYNLAIAEIRLGDFAAAADHAWKAVEQSRGSARALEAAREAFLKASRAPELADRLEALSRSLPENDGLRLALADALVLANRPGDALREATEVLRRDETNVLAMMSIARAYLAMKRLDAAEYVAGQAAEVAKDPRALAVLGHVAWFKGDAKRAMAFYQESLKGDPAQPEVQNNLAALLQDAGDPAAAEQAAQEALRLDPGYRDAWINLGNARRVRQDVAGAIAAYREALRLDPDCAECEFNLGVAEMENRPPEQDEPGHWRRAIEHLSRFRVLRRGPARVDPTLDAYLDEARRNADFLEKEQERLRQAPAPQTEGSKAGEAGP